MCTVGSPQSHNTAVLQQLIASSKCSCYSYDARSTSLDNGRALCKEGNGDLVSLETIDEWEFMKDELQNKSTKNNRNEWWIGLHYDNNKEQWKWFSNLTLTYNKWQPKKPNEVETKRNALVAREFPKPQKGSFNNVQKSSVTRGFICEYPYSEGRPACHNDKYWCSPTTTTHLSTSRPPSDFTTLVVQSSTMASTEKPLYSTGPSSHFSKDKQDEFPVYAIIIILLIVVVIALLSTVFLYRLKKKRELKPRNSHLSKDSRVPVRLEHNSSTNNLNDKIIYADVVNMDGKQIHVNSHAEPEFRQAAKATEMSEPSNQGNGSIYYCINNEERTSNKETTEHSRRKSWNKSSDKEKLMSDFDGERNEALATCLCTNVDRENNQKITLVYAEVGDFKESGPTSPSYTLPEPYSETDYAVIVTSNN